VLEHSNPAPVAPEPPGSLGTLLNLELVPSDRFQWTTDQLWRRQAGPRHVQRQTGAPGLGHVTRFSWIAVPV
jgi:hypothetical protein